ncbi:MAG: UvrB/UvrC motif-containing protein [Gemmataceae bacterium]|nr:UvrB/UvrC motif-containing protein [Gemmataceae bacterium]
MSKHIDDALRGWDHDADTVQARLVKGSDGRAVIQMRVELGVLQLETTGRPDGKKPHGHRTYFDHLKHQFDAAQSRAETFVLDQEQCHEADREFVQFYHRRICWLALRRYAEAVADADHTLAFMDFVRDHSPSEEYTRAHEQYRGFVTFQRTQGAAALALEKDNPEAAIDEVRQGLGRLRDFFTEHGEEGRMEDDGMVRHLRKMETFLRREHHIEETLRERLDRAVADEDYELAARLRDELRQRGC